MVTLARSSASSAAFVLMIVAVLDASGMPSASRWPASSGGSRSSRPGYMAFSHGSNDAQKTMGIITLALFSAGVIDDDRGPDLGHRRVGDGAVPGDRGRGLADHAHDGPSGRRAGAGPRVRRRDDRRDRPARHRPARACRSRRPTSSPAPSWASARHAAPRACAGVSPGASCSPGSSPSRPPAHRGRRRMVRPRTAIGFGMSPRGATAMSFRLLPKDVQFFDLFTADGENLRGGRHASSTRWSSTTTGSRSASREIQRLEKAGDEIDREITERLEDAFVTPFDREDIHELTRHASTTSSTASRRPPRPSSSTPSSEPTEEARELARILAAQAVELLEALRKLDGLKGLEPHLERGPRARAPGRRPVTGGHRGASSGRPRTPSRSSSGAISTASSRTPSTRPRTPAEVIERMYHKATLTAQRRTSAAGPGAWDRAGRRARASAGRRRPGRGSGLGRLGHRSESERLAGERSGGLASGAERAGPSDATPPVDEFRPAGRGGPRVAQASQQADGRPVPAPGRAPTPEREHGATRREESSDGGAAVPIASPSPNQRPVAVAVTSPTSGPRAGDQRSAWRQDRAGEINVGIPRRPIPGSRAVAGGVRLAFGRRNT